MNQLSFFVSPRFPSTRYQGSKAKLAAWIGEQIKDLPYQTCLDAFGGTGVIAYKFKLAGKSVSYNDILRFNFWIAKALIENNDTRLSDQQVARILAEPEAPFPDLIQKHFRDIYFTEEENHWLDRTHQQIQQLANPYEFAIAFFALAQACIIKRPYNLFHRKNLYIRTAEVERSFGNKVTWDRPFEEWFSYFVKEANQAVFDSGQKHLVLNQDIFDLENRYDLVYLDPPYLSRKGVGVDYRDFYHFLEGLSMYDEWEKHLDHHSKHLRLKKIASPWLDKSQIYGAFERVFEQFADSILVLSYRSDGLPSLSELLDLMKRFKKQVIVKDYGEYQYALSKNRQSTEVLLIGL